GLLVDDLIDHRVRGMIVEGLVRDVEVHDLRIVARDRARIRSGDALACGQFGRDSVARRQADGLNDRRWSRRPRRPDAEIRTHGSLLEPLPESNPTPSRTQPYKRCFNVLLENAPNRALTQAHNFA